MKIRKLIFGFFPLALAAGFIAGCATTGYEKADSTATTLSESSDMVAKGNVLIDETLANLNDLVSHPGPDLHKQFNAFNNSVNELGLTARDVTVKSERMRVQGAAYFKNWDNEMAKIKNEDIRQRSEARKNEVSAHFDRITQLYEETKAAFVPYMSDLRDVQKFLSVDLTSGGLSAIKGVVAKATEHAAPLKESMGKLSGEFKDLGFSMSTKTWTE
jgi:hypothetical protein